MPVFSPRTGSASTTSTSAAPGPSTDAWRQRRPAQRADSGERSVAARRRPSRSASTRCPSFASTAGRSVSVAASTKATLSMIPSAVDRNAGLGTSRTADNDTRTVIAENSTACPAVSIVTTTASRTPSRESDARKRWTMKSA